MKIRKFIYIVFGILSLILGFIGIFLPLLPTTPFLLLSAYLFSKSSKKLFVWMYKNKYFGEYLTKYKEGKGIPLKTKIIAIIMLWISIMFTVVEIIPLLIIKILLLMLAAYISFHIIKQPTFKK